MLTHCIWLFGCPTCPVWLRPTHVVIRRRPDAHPGCGWTGYVGALIVWFVTVVPVVVIYTVRGDYGALTVTAVLVGVTRLFPVEPRVGLHSTTPAVYAGCYRVTVTRLRTRAFATRCRLRSFVGGYGSRSLHTLLIDLF